MTQIDEIKKFINETIFHYEAIMQLGKALPSDKNYIDAFKSIKNKIYEIESKPRCTCPAFNVTNECYKLGCKIKRSPI